MRFLLEQSALHLEEALRRQAAGDLKGAREGLLLTARYLFQAARHSDPPFREVRIRKAEELVARAEELGEILRRRLHPIPQATAEGSGGEGEEWLVAERPKVRLEDVAGLEEAKRQIRLRMIYPFTHPELAQKYGIKQGGGILLYGPPGTGKTLLARAVAGEVDAAFFTVKPSEILSKWVGEAEKNVARLFAAARSYPRSVIFIDEVEALVPKRRDSSSTVMQRVVPQILQEMEGFSSGSQDHGALLFLGATNEPWSLDPAVLRPGRFDERIYIPLPDLEGRIQILAMNLKDRPLGPDVDIAELARRLEGYSGADLRRLCEKASDIPFLEAVRSGVERPIERRDFLAVLEQFKPSVDPISLQRFERFAGHERK
jgi:transitional endoplasmic reticulum ATPase